MSDALRELLATFTTEVDTTALEKGHEKVEHFSSKLKELAFTVGEVFAIEKLGEFVRGTAESVEQLEVLSQRLGVTTDDIQNFQYAVKLTGGDIGTANQGLTLFTRNIGEAQTGGGGAQYFQKLGVSIRDAHGEIKPTGELLGDVAEGFKKLTNSGDRTAVAMGLFGRSGAQLIPILAGGKEKMAEMAAELEKNGGLIDEKTIAVVAESAKEMNKLSFSLVGVKAQIVGALAPALNSLVHWIQSGASVLKEFAEHTTLVQSVMAGLIAIATVAAFVWGILNIEFLIIVAAVALLIIAFDDLYGWWTGKDSFFGRVLDKVFGRGTSTEFLASAKAAWDEIAAAASVVWEAFKEVAGAVREIWGAAHELAVAFDEVFGTKALENFNPLRIWFDYVKTELGFLKDIVVGFLHVVSAAAHSLSELMHAGGKVASLAGAVLGGNPKRAAEVLSGSKIEEGGWISHALDTVRGILPGRLPQLPPSQVSNANSNIHQQNHTSITVNASSNAEEIASKVGGAVEDAHRDYADDFAAAPGGG